MPAMQTTDEKVPYLKRLPAPDKIGDAVGILSSYLFRYFPGADGIEQFIHRKGELESFFREFSKKDNENKEIAHKLRMKRFYHEVFDETVDLEQFKSPYASAFGYEMYVIPVLTSQKLLYGARKLLRVELLDMMEDTDIFIKRKNSEYTFTYSGYTGPDRKLLLTEQQSIGDLVERQWITQEWTGSCAMNCFEYILCATFRYWLLGKTYDNEGQWTFFPQSIMGSVVSAQSQGYNHYTFSRVTKTTKGPSFSGMRGIYLFCLKF